MPVPRALITEREVEAARAAGCIAIPAGALVTPLARDLIDRYGLRTEAGGAAAQPAEAPRTPAGHVVANWKCNKGQSDALAWAAAVRAARPAAACGGSTPSRFAAAVAPPFPYIAAVAQAARGSGVAVGAQDVSPFADGAYTGTVSARMVRDVGGTFAILGHSERRAHFGEEATVIARKCERALEAGLAVLLCVGESADDRRAGRTERLLADEVRGVLSRVAAPSLGPGTLVLAYEPIWAIGTGLTPGPEDVLGAVGAIRDAARGRLGDAAAVLSVLYGGSVNPRNVRSLVAGGDADGALVGGASLDAGSFVEILAALAAP